MLMDTHLDPVQLSRLLRLDCTHQEAFDWLFHLMTCRRCRHRLENDFTGGRELLQTVFRRVGREQLSSRRGPGLTGARFRVLLSHLRRQGTAVLDEREEAPRLVRELAAHPPARRRLLLVNGQRFRRLGLAFALLEQARSLWQEDPRGADDWAEDCLELVKLLNPASYDPHLLQDVRGLAWAYWGNSRRILGEAADAEEAFARARECFRQGSDDPADRANLRSFQASLAEMQGRTQKALDLLDQALALYRHLDDPRGRLRTTIQRAHVLDTGGDPEQAVAILETLGIEGTEAGDGPADGTGGAWAQADLAELYGIARQNLALLLVDTGRCRRARRLLPAVRKSGQTIGRMHRLRITWLEGRICAGDGDPDRARRLLTSVRQAFIDEGLGLDTALVTLDLAAVYLQTGRRQQARALAAEMLPLFLAQDVEREACAALLLFHRALRNDSANAILAREIGSHLRRLQHRKTPTAIPH